MADTQRQRSGVIRLQNTTQVITDITYYYFGSTPVCVKKERNGQASANQGFSIASQGSCHVHGTLY